MTLLTLDLSQIDQVLTALDAEVSVVTRSTDPENFVNALRLNKIEANLDQLRKELISLNYHQHKNTDTYKQFVRLTELVASAKFRYQASIEVYEGVQTERQPEPVVELSPSDSGESLAELRRRLLKDGTQAKLLDSSSPVAQNNYHESLQNDLVEDISSLVSVLRSSALRFQEELLEDSEILQKTMSSIDENSNLMRNVNGFLRQYNLNTGDKVSFWFLLKALGYVLGLFLLMFMTIQLFKS
ncbi:hypothetical protein BABINDRAFT_9650 [Babjeviella inositovora NRRL Y-12698]|uniref:Uncharacterized protein n=1 Tax=Babjeviella inositovora NRRL Y-12698 TaxID=984486 RepID=A0A1E3QK27_9ASCO|nr:uncharacterized protein BABINDRAFT_9650 [Babjeviella inositovora NRRL Y-12698]ODQ78043.1 hypothetical protein BABINDRAFT_9650 [Babjeviella inositovora NRRL Y-12698]